MLKYKDDVEVNVILSFCEDIMRYLEGETKEECETNQHYVGMKELFRRHVVLDWFGNNFRYTKYKK